MKKLYTNPNAELLSLHTDDIMAASKESDDIISDSFDGAADGYERVF